MAKEISTGNTSRASTDKLRIGVDGDLTEDDRATWVDSKQKKCGSLNWEFEESEVFPFWCKTRDIQRC